MQILDKITVATYTYFHVSYFSCKSLFIIYLPFGSNLFVCVLLLLVTAVLFDADVESSFSMSSSTFASSSSKIMDTMSVALKVVSPVI